MTTLLAASVLGGVGLAPPAVGAQEQDAFRVTLDDALRIAEGSNPTYRRALNESGLNGIEMRTTWLDQLLPSTTLQLATSYTGNRQGSALDNFGNPIANPNADWTYFSNTTQRLTLNWRVRGPSVFQAHRRQSVVNEGRTLAQVTALTGVQSQVRLFYMDALEQRELAESEAELLEARRIDLDVAERLFRLGSKTRVDVLNAELAVAQQALALQQQDAQYQTALLELASALGTDEARPLELVAIDLPIFDPAGVDARALVAQALDVNPALRESEVAVQSATLGVSEQKAAWWPEVGLQFSVTKQPRLPGTEALFDPSFDRDLDSTFGISLSFPMFNNFFSTRQSQQQATVLLRNEVETEREARITVEKDVRSAVLTLNSQWESLQVLERSAEIAGEALRLSREQYRLGQLEFEGLRQTFDQEADSRRQVITARHAFVEALLTLEQAVGGPVRPAASPAPDAPAGS